MIRLKPDVEWQEVDGEVIVLDLAESQYHVVNGSGAALWPLLASGATPDQLVAALRARFPDSSERAARDVDAFIEQLHALAVVTEDR